MPLTYFITCPFGTENVAHADLISLLESYETPAELGEPWYTVEHISSCYTCYHGPALPASALHVAIGGKGGLKSLSRVSFGNDRNEEKRQQAAAEANLITSSTQSEQNGGPKATKRPRDALENNSKVNIVQSATARQLTTEQIQEQKLERLVKGSEVSKTIESNSKFRGTISFRFQVNPSTTLCSKRDKSVATTPRRLLLDEIYYLRSIMGIFVHLNTSASATLSPELVEYDPFEPIQQQKGLREAIDKLCSPASNSDLTTSNWEHIIEEINETRDCSWAANDDSRTNNLLEAHKELLLPPLQKAEDSLVLFRVSCSRYDKTQSTSPQSLANEGEKDNHRPYAKVTSADIERFVGGLLGERFAPEIDEDCLKMAVQDRPPMPTRPHRASMLYYHFEVTVHHDHDKVLLGVCLHDSCAPRVDKEERPFRDTSKLGLDLRNKNRRDVIKAMLPAALKARSSFKSGAKEPLVTSDESKDAPGADMAIVAPYRQLTMARPASFKHDLRWAKGDNSMNPALASMLSYYTFGKLSCSSDTAQAGNAPPFVCIDPLGGIGSTMLEMHLRALKHAPNRPIVSMAGDLRLSEARAMAANFDVSHYLDQCEDIFIGRNRDLFLSRPITATAFQWDATKLPFKDSSVDAIISDLPFGRRCGNATINDQLYTKLLVEFHRVLVPYHSDSESLQPGRCVLLTIERRLMVTALVTASLLGAKFRIVMAPFVVDMGGLVPYVFVLEKM